MTYWCPHCWAELEGPAQDCPTCGESLEQADADYVDKLIDALRHPEPTRAAVAIHILTDLQAEPRAIEPLVALLDQSSDAYILRQAVTALGRFGDARAVQPLSRLAGDAEQALVVRVAALEALARIGGDTAEAALRRALTDPIHSMQKRARRWLAEQAKGQGKGAPSSAPDQPETAND